jgi:hypothetical protein
VRLAKRLDDGNYSQLQPTVANPVMSCMILMGMMMSAAAVKEASLQVFKR